ncbi:restriction endonuclease [Thiolapillus sp.]
MAKRKQSLFEGLIELAAQLPWWAGVLLAAISYVIIHHFAVQPMVATTTPGQFSQAITVNISQTLATIFQYILPGGFLIGALVSALKRTKRKRLLNITKEAVHPNAVKSLSWQEFEVLVGQVFRHRGYTVRETAKGADGGVDLELRKDGELKLVQCKQWRATKVGVRIVRELFGVMAARGATGAYVVTSGVFTKEARNFADGRNITLIDGSTLEKMIKKAATQPMNQSANVETSAPSCPKCGGAMVKRIARKGKNAGQQFWGCASFPKCHGTLAIDQND